MEWANIRSLAQEANLWLSLPVNIWLAVSGIRFVFRRTGSFELPIALALLAMIVIRWVGIPITIAAAFYPSLWPYVLWLCGVQGGLLFAGIAMQAVEMIKRRQISN